MVWTPAFESYARRLEQTIALQDIMFRKFWFRWTLCDHRKSSILLVAYHVMVDIASLFNSLVTNHAWQAEGKLLGLWLCGNYRTGVAFRECVILDTNAPRWPRIVWILVPLLQMRKASSAKKRMPSCSCATIFTSWRHIREIIVTCCRSLFYSTSPVQPFEVWSNRAVDKHRDLPLLEPPLGLYQSLFVQHYY